MNTFAIQQYLEFFMMLDFSFFALLVVFSSSIQHFGFNVCLLAFLLFTNLESIDGSNN